MLKKYEADLILPNDIKLKLINEIKRKDEWLDLQRKIFGFNNLDGFYQLSISSTLIENFIPKLKDLEISDVYLLMTTPEYHITKHIDNRSFGRKIALTRALTPDNLDEFAPTIFHSKEDEYKYYYSNKCFIFDTWVPHSMINNNHTRILFQIRYITNIKFLIEALKNAGIPISEGVF